MRIVVHRRITLGIVLVCAAPLTAWSAGAGTDYATLLEGQLVVLTNAAERDIGRIHELAQSTGSTSESNVPGTVTSDLARSFVDKPAGFSMQLEAIQKSLQASLVKTAQDIEEKHRAGFLDGTDAGAVYASLRGAALARADEIATAVSDNNISILHVYLALQLIMNFNNKLIDEALSAQDPIEVRRLYMTQAAYVYEFSNVVIRVLDEAQLAGLESLRALRNDNQSRISRRLAEINLQRRTLADDVKSGMLTDQSASRMETSYVQIIRANQEVMAVWNYLLESTVAQQEFFASLARRAAQVRQKQQLAKFQMDTLRDVLMVGANLDPLDRIEDASLQFAQLPLLELDPLSVLQLVGGAGGADVAN